MSEDSLLKRIAKMLISNNETLLAGTDDKIKASEKRLDKSASDKFAASEKRQNNKTAKMLISNNARLVASINQSVDRKIEILKQEVFAKIDLSQEDTIESLSGVINTGYNHQEERLKRIEDELNLPAIKLKQ